MSAVLLPTDAAVVPAPALRTVAATAWPSGFLWGAATSAGQIEGAVHTDGREDSVWDAFARVPGNVADGDTPERGVEHLARMPADIALLGELGLNAYRFSVSWARVRPGDRYRNDAGLAFYDRLVDELLARDVVPFLTLYHWDLPQALEERGGWTARETAERFVRYVEDVHSVLGDRVRRWTTFNEPFCSAFIGHASGEHAPGRQDPAAALAALHHQHLAHGLASLRLRELRAGQPDLQVGISLNLTTAVPADPDDPVDVDAARRVDALWNRAFLDPVLHGRYPEDFLADVAGLGLEEVVLPGDLETIAQPLDFLGVNHYHDDCVTGHPQSGPGGLRPTEKPTRSPFVGSEHVGSVTRDLPLTEMGWEVNPAGLTRLLVRLATEHPGLALHVTENGAAYADVVTADGRVHDVERTAFVAAHVAAVADAVAQGADVRGFFAWSLLDNFEWAWGYAKRFGIVHVDHATQVRTVKDSGRGYAALVSAARSADHRHADAGPSVGVALA
ncbi:beta-glucosidase [Microlunatus sagamiharensis]|uniref:Beta-glucosidase n=1 Tax=Microlunatus sagamiharensis TaxID=546874 RepID=A0A1H2NED1_9ACTN|nr:GH1 family beta-glucosidase [Microlunatus sagamiharensis]SDV03792.1 beta-glucosidase [Microlunatus sagamiharensis]